MTSTTSMGPKATRSRRTGREPIIKEDKQNDRRYHKTGERPDRDWTGRPGRSPR
jgi:hypothetical protein